MDIELIEQKQLVERYLFGRLTPPEARFFEKLLRESPELADRLRLPEALKRTMQLLDDTGTEWRQIEPRFWHRPWVPAALAACVLLALALALTGWVAKRNLETRYQELQQEAGKGLLTAPTRSAIMRLRLGRPAETAPVYTLGGRGSPTFAELRVDVGFAPAMPFRVTIRRDDGTYWARLDNQLRDSNGDLRLAVNSAAFAAGTYDLAVESVNLRGEGTPTGRLQLRIDPG